MARTTPVHSGYTIINGAGTGSNGGRIDVWVEYKLGSKSVSGNYTPITAYFYAALNPSYSSTTSYASGLNSQFSVNGTAGTGVSGGAYDFTASSKVNLLGSFSGNIPHDADGTKSVTITGSFTTVSAYITGGTVSANLTLPSIARAASLSAGDSTLGGSCMVQWTPASTGHTFSLSFSLGGWSDTVTGIAPGSTAGYAYSKALPLTLARQFTGKSAQMYVTLTTYQGTAKLGSSSETVTVTVPDREETRPRVEATLRPASTPFPGLFVQGLSRVGAAISAQDPYGAEITGYTMTVEGKSYTGADGVSGFLTGAGEVAVTVTATNSRGFTGSAVYEIPVIAYTPPRITQVRAYRCDSQGAAAEGGQSLYLAVTPAYSDVQGQNTCTLTWRIKPEKGSWSDPVTLIEGVVMDSTLSKDTAYTLEVTAADTAGNTSTAKVAIASEKVYMHRPVGGAGLGLGGYVGEEDLLDIYWKVNARKPITAPSVNCRGVCTDANTAILPGIYQLTASTVGSPCGEGLLLVYNASESGQSGTVFQLAVDATGKVYARIRWNGTQNTWRTLTT